MHGMLSRSCRRLAQGNAQHRGGMRCMGSSSSPALRILHSQQQSHMHPRHASLPFFAYLFSQQRNLATMSTSEIRKRYTEFFMKNGHTLQPSADIVPKNDTTLLFTNAGMVPFKQFFLNPQMAPYKQVTTVQKCVRAGGKHNDLDQVGYTPRHHTFFEMLGNFSFGAYDKKAIIHMAWKFVTEELRMPREMLRVTVLETDDEAYGIWRDEIGLDPKRIVRLGPEDNFWSMGNGEGPCGPSSEIFWDTQNPQYPEDHEERWLEFWNLVFMQFYRGADGELKKLDVPCIDTGMGLERVACILQGKKNNFDTDEFQAIIQDIDKLQSRGDSSPAGQSRAVDESTVLTYKRIIADHLRASAFLISEGVYPSNTGRGYVLRRIIRRAARAGRLLGINGAVLSALYPSLVKVMGEAYPELVERREPIVSVLQSEEDAFLRTLGKGLTLLESIFASDTKGAGKVVSADDAFALYDTHGFPIDLTQVIARDNGWGVDVGGFERIQQETRERNKSSWKSGPRSKSSVASEIEAARLEWQDSAVTSRFSGYEIDPEASALPSAQSARVVAFRGLSNGDGMAVIDPCPFYASGGGQEADHGVIELCDAQGGSHAFTVKDATALPNGQATVIYLDAAADSQDLLVPGANVSAAIDIARRYGNAVHHTATHLLNAALRKVVGTTVMQAGSLVQPDGLRFDFTSSALSSEQLQEIEDYVNKVALESPQVGVREMTLDEAKAAGAVATFTEKYDPECVRVVDVPGVSTELCGGTHLHSTRAVYPFQIISEGSIGAGTRRIEAVAGTAGSGWLRSQLKHAKATAQTLGATKLGAMNKKAQQLVDKSKALQGEAEGWLRLAAASVEAAATHATALSEGRIPTAVHIIPPLEGGQGNARLVSERACHLRDSEPHSAHLVIQGKAVALAVSADAFPDAQAGALLREVFAKLPGRGGGQGQLANGQLSTAVASPDQVKGL